MILRSPTRCSMNLMSHSRLKASKNRAMSASRTQLILRALISVRERVQRIVLVAPGTEPITKTQELRLVDWREDCDHRCLDDFILQSRDAERSLLTICLRYVPAARCSARYAPEWTLACRSVRFRSRSAA